MFGPDVLKKARYFILLVHDIFFSEVAGWDLKKILLAVMIIVLVVIPACIITLLLCRRYNPRVKEFFDHHTQM